MHFALNFKRQITTLIAVRGEDRRKEQQAYLVLRSLMERLTVVQPDVQITSVETRSQKTLRQ